jgi:flavin reductase (DIM6/NTAB) family NADH-FMN oxidoreductase RutF
MPVSTTLARISADRGDRHAMLPADTDLFRQISRCWASGVAVVTTRSPRGPGAGLTMTAVSSLSINPMQYLICLDHGSKTGEAIKSEGVFCINILGSDQRSQSDLFASKSDKKLDQVDYVVAENGVPILCDTLASIMCEVAAIHVEGDHDIVVGRFVTGRCQPAAPLVHFDRGYYQVRAM